MVKETCDSPESNEVFAFKGKNYRCSLQCCADSALCRDACLWRQVELERHGACRLLFDDYPFAADGILLWKAIHGWVENYVRIYYQGPADLAGDVELQAWWADVRKGHKDKAEGWPEPKGTEVGMGSAADVLGGVCVSCCARDVSAQLLQLMNAAGRLDCYAMLDQGLRRGWPTP